MRLKTEMDKGKIDSSLENGKINIDLPSNSVLGQIVFIHSNYHYVSPYGTSQENIEVEG